jgi:hypothetical protein
MKNKGIRIFLALILSLAMIIGTTSIVNAGPPVRTVSATIIGVTDTTVVYTFEWDGWGGWGIEAVLFTYDQVDMVTYYAYNTRGVSEPVYEWVLDGKRKKTYTSPVVVTIPNDGADYMFLRVWVVNKNGRHVKNAVIQVPYPGGTWPQVPQP